MARFTAVKNVKAIVPLLDRVLVQRIKSQQKTAAGILIPEKSLETLNEGKVIAVGKGALDKEGKHIPNQVKPGDRVLLPSYGGSTLKVEEEEYSIFRDSEILAKKVKDFWVTNTKENFVSLKRDLALSNLNEDENSNKDEKSMWKNIENKLEKIQIEELGYDYPLCSRILDDSSKPFTKLSEEDKKVFKAPSDTLEVQCIYKKSVIYSCLLEQTKIPWSITTSEDASKDIYSLTAIACCIRKLQYAKWNEYNNDSDETTSTVSTPPGSPSRTRKVSDLIPHLREDRRLKKKKRANSRNVFSSP
ncbi:27021_t:CDS:2 [Dentiscutata erythropus]|uniref:27021_t:CDS:1 n=1 Tax=Dentiscutata erythropus TaxID=1348616 RepID=A0A9N8ZCB5_9GLOM|nr:27021_t:CDS:2 [Dentiscutata erythropus]